MLARKCISVRLLVVLIVLAVSGGVQAQQGNATRDPQPSEKRNVPLGESRSFFKIVTISLSRISPREAAATATFTATVEGSTKKYENKEIGFSDGFNGYQISLNAIDLAERNEAAFQVTPIRTDGSTKGPNNTALASWIFGTAFVVFLMAIVVYQVIWGRPVDPLTQKILGIICALLAGLFGVFMTGTATANFAPDLGPIHGLSIQAAGGVALFVIVLLWWRSENAPVKSSKKELQVPSPDNMKETTGQED